LSVVWFLYKFRIFPINKCSGDFYNFVGNGKGSLAFEIVLVIVVGVNNIRVFVILCSIRITTCHNEEQYY
jgi:hypothetical protein